MKNSKSLLVNFLKQNEPTLIDAIQDAFTLRHLDNPMMSDMIKCPVCYGSEGHHCLIDPKNSDKRMWFCSNSSCLALFMLCKHVKATPIPTTVRESTKWALFCEINSIGDRHSDVHFDKIEQSSQKIDYLKKFCDNPTGMIIMQGSPGTGKTYAAVGLCRRFIKKDDSCLFFTQDSLATEWQREMMSEIKTRFIDRIKGISLLVIDDFGIKEPSPGFLQFFMSIIDTRLQWNKRGTIITTNLKEDALSSFCGDSLMDRLRTGQYFDFTGESRRKQNSI